MRAKEFVSEQKNKLSKRQQWSTRGLHTFTDSNYDRLYILNRVMMAAASTDGKNDPGHMESESWVAKQNVAFPYSQVDHEKMHMAFKMAGVPFQHDINKGDLESVELPGGNISSPIKPFKGYKK